MIETTDSPPRLVFQTEGLRTLWPCCQRTDNRVQSRKPSAISFDPPDCGGQQTKMDSPYKLAASEKSPYATPAGESTKSIGQGGTQGKDKVAS